MGGCCSCCGCSQDSSDGGGTDKEMELQAQKSKKALSISETMSAPTIIRKTSNTISGQGLALAGVTIEQDVAYWEWHMKAPSKKTMESILFGVTAKKDAKFYQDLPPEKCKTIEEDGPSQVNGTQWMRRIDFENGDVIGVAIQQSDLPMVQFSLNGEPLHISAINRFQGTMYPAIYLPFSTDDLGVEATLVVEEANFKYARGFGDRFGPIIVARSIV